MSLGKWYQPGSDDSIYQEALDACRASNSRLAKYLPPNDLLLLSGKADKHENIQFNAVVVGNFIEERYRESKDKLELSKKNWLSEACNTFASVALRLAEVFDPLVPQSPEYTVPYGCLMITFKILVAKQEKKDKVITVFENLQRKLPFLGLYDVLFPTDEMKKQLVQTYLHVLDLVVCVTEYCAIGRISKLVDITSLNPKYDFDECLERIEQSYKMLKTLAESASLAVLKDTHEILKEQSRIIDYIALQSQSLAANISALNQAMSELQVKQTKIQRVQTKNWSDGLISALLPDANKEWEDLNMWQSREFRLSPKDHWEVNGMLEYLRNWNELESASILAIFGPTDDRDTWVTEFSLDMIQAFKVQDSLVMSAMCDHPSGQVFTPMIVIQTLICQLLEQKPELTIDTPDIFNLRAFQKIKNFEDVCRLFMSAVARLTTPAAIIVDRIDCCCPDIDDGKDPQNLVGFLSEILMEHQDQIKVIITSAEEPPEEEDLHPELAISICMISTRRRPLYKEWYSRGIRRRPAFRISAFATDDGPERYWTALGVEQLNKFRWLRNRGDFEMSVNEPVRPRTVREKLILHFFDFESNCIGVRYTRRKHDV